MSSKNAEYDGTASASRKAPTVWSITRRFTVLYVASTAILLLLAVGFLHWALARNLSARDLALLTSKVQVLRLLLREQPDKTEALASEVEHEASESQIKYYLRILDRKNHVLLQTPGMKEILPVSLFPAPALTSDELPDNIGRRVRSHASFLLLSAQVAAGATAGETRILHVALDTSADLALLADYRRKLLVLLVLGLMFAAVVGGWLARKGAQPLVEITKSAQHITGSQLHDRIIVSRWPAELVQLAEAFNGMLDRLEDSFTRLSQFSGDLAHELRPPINNLRGEAEVSLARTRTLEEYQQILASSLEEYERLSRMIDGLLFIARADNPKVVVERVCFDARKEIEAVRDLFEVLADEQDVTVTCDGHAWLNADPSLFRRAINNLLANALQHTQAKGSIHISIGRGGNRAVELSVRDTGVGISPEHLPKVFDRFYRVERSRAKTPGSTGLGLAIVQSIMRLHGGTASVSSRLGEGTTVTLQFPSAPASAPSGQMTKM